MRLFGWYYKPTGYRAQMSVKGRAWLAKASTRDVVALLAASIVILQVTACAPKVIKEPYPVREVREVYRPIPDEYTRALPTPKLKDGSVLVEDLATLLKDWQAFGKTANEHRGKVKTLSEGE